MGAKGHRRDERPYRGVPRTTSQPQTADAPAPEREPAKEQGQAGAARGSPGCGGGRAAPRRCSGG
eukprot:11186693-Lingulodinium_polyedra.AAC.1